MTDSVSVSPKDPCSSDFQMIVYPLPFQFACVTLCWRRPAAQGVCQVAVKQTGRPEIIIQWWETDSLFVITSLLMMITFCSGRHPTDDHTLRPGLFRSLTHPAFQSIHIQSCQTLTSDGKVRPTTSQRRDPCVYFWFWKFFFNEYFFNLSFLMNSTL